MSVAKWQCASLHCFSKSVCQHHLALIIIHQYQILIPELILLIPDFQRLINVCWAHRLPPYYRYLSVCRPIRARSWCTPRKAKLQLLVLVCTAVIYSIPRFIEYYTVLTELEHSLSSSCETDLHHSEGILDFLYSKLCWNFELTTDCAASQTAQNFVGL